jgi:hypothetical protein
VVIHETEERAGEGKEKLAVSRDRGNNRQCNFGLILYLVLQTYVQFYPTELKTAKYEGSLK